MLKIKRRLTGHLITGLLALSFLPLAEAGLYKCMDANNRIYYQDKPCQDLRAARLPGNLARLSGKQEERSFFWKAVGEKGTLYLMGSLPYGKPSMYPLPQIIMDAFIASSALVVETDIRNLDDKELFTLLKGKGRYEDKDTLEAHVKQGTWNKAVAVGKKLGTSEETLRHYKPWLAAILLSGESLKQAGFTPELGIGQTFLKESQGRKSAMEMESLEQQIATLDELPPLEQEQFLLQTLQDLSRGPDYYNNLTEYWQKGDLEMMDQLTRQSYDIGETSMKLFKAFFEDRNERIATRLKEFAGEDKTYFIVVGAGHLGGDKGLIRLLEKKGLKITQP